MRFLVLVSALLLSFPVLAVSPDDIIGWTKAGVAEADIIDRVRKDPPASLPGAHEVLRLKEAGVSDAVIKALIGTEDQPQHPAPAPVPEPEPIPTPSVIRTIDDIIAAYRDGVPPAEIEMRVRGLNLKVLRADRERMRAAGVPDSIIDAAARRVAPLSDRRASSKADPQKKQFGDSGTIILEAAGGFQSVSFGDETFTTVMLTPGLHVLTGILSFGVEGSFASSFASSGHVSFFGVAGVAVPIGESRSALLRLGARIGYGAPASADGSVAYGFSAAGLGRTGRLLVGAGVTATWMGDPTVSMISLDLRIGTWF